MNNNNNFLNFIQEYLSTEEYTEFSKCYNSIDKETQILLQYYITSSNPQERSLFEEKYVIQIEDKSRGLLAYIHKLSLLNTQLKSDLSQEEDSREAEEIIKNL